RCNAFVDEEAVVSGSDDSEDEEDDEDAGSLDGFVTDGTPSVDGSPMGMEMYHGWALTQCPARAVGMAPEAGAVGMTMERASELLLLGCTVAAASS
ncbi:hypothetical protein HaLaN_25177, partial [Haematococcus lacustris]